MTNKIKCPNCGTLNPRDAKFCVRCGLDLEDIKTNISEKHRESNNLPKKHKLLWIVVIAFIALIVIGGLFIWKSNKQPTATQHSTTNNATQASDYDQLSKSEKKKVHFKFTLSQDDTKDNTADSVYVVSMKVINKTNRTIKFRKNKFVYLLPTGKVLSSKKGTLSIKAGNQDALDQLFEDVDEQATVGSGIIVYLNRSNKLAYANFVNNVATSNNLTNEKLIEQNKNTSGESSYSTNDSDNTSPSTDYSGSSQSSSETSASSTASSVAIHNSSEAIAAAKSAYGSDTFEGRSLNWGAMTSNGSDLMSGGYYWVKADDGTTMSGTTLSYFVYPNGNVVRQQ